MAPDWTGSRSRRDSGLEKSEFSPLKRKKEDTWRSF
jgi:hypothetical protein